MDSGDFAAVAMGDLDLACSSLQGNGVRFFENRSRKER